MKRTRETINYTHPAERWNLSGAVNFDGEDRDYDERTKANQQTQRQWLMEQIEEKKQAKALAKQQDQ